MIDIIEFIFCLTYTKLLFQDRKKLYKTGETKEEKKTSSFLSNYSLYVRDMLLVRPQKKSSKTVSCNIAVQKKFGTREWRYLV